MLYVGFPVSVKEALRLLKLDENIVTSYYDTEPIQKYLQTKKSKLTFFYGDKGSCVLGIPLSDSILPFETAFGEILVARSNFILEARALDLDFSHVEITQIEKESVVWENPDPFLISV